MSLIRSQEMINIRNNAIKLHINNKAKFCFSCDGYGSTFEYDCWNNEWYEECTKCKGKGYI